MKKKFIISVGVLIALLVLSFLIFFMNIKSNKKYTITFDTNGGSTVEAVKIKKGEPLSKPNDPTKEGYIFIGWTLNGEAFDFTTPITENIKLVATWQEQKDDIDTFVVTFDTDGGSTILNQVIEKGSTVKKPNDPTKEGYTFKGWYVGSSEYNFDTEITKDLTIKAKWEKKEEQKINSNNSSNKTTTTSSSKVSTSNKSNSSSNTQNTSTKKYTVTFNSNGGTSISSQIVTEGSKATQPSNPTRSGYTFSGWTLNGSSYNFNSAVTGNITLVANWKEVVKNKYTVTFNSNGGSSISSQTVTEGSKATQPSNPTREGYTFSGWTLNGGRYNFNSAVTSNIILTATWAQKTYTVRVSIIDPYSPDRILTVYENGIQIPVSAIKYTDGYTLCSGSNTTVNKNDIEGENTLIVVLSGGTQVTASVS